MSRTYDNVAPSVIDDEMLQIAVEEQGPKDEAGRIAKAEGIDFADVKALRLDFKSNYYVVMTHGCLRNVRYLEVGKCNKTRLLKLSGRKT